MKIKVAPLTLILLIGLTVGVWFSIVYTQVQSVTAYQRHLDRGAKYESKEIFKDALTEYSAALEANPKDYDLAMKVAEMYKGLGNHEGFISYCETAKSAKPGRPESYIALAEYYIDIADYTDALKILAEGEKAVKDNQEIATLQAKMESQTVEKIAAYDAVGSWRQTGGKSYAVVEYNKRRVLVGKDGKKILTMECDAMGSYDSEAGVFPVLVNGLWYYADIEGDRRLVGDHPYDELGSFGDGLAPARWDGKYGYIDRDFNEQRHEFDYAGAFVNGVAAVDRGGKWALINSNLQEITEYDYDEILVDSNGFCATYKTIAARKGSAWVLLDREGKRVGSQTYDAISIAASNVGPVAVKVGEKWGFVSQDKGEMVLAPAYDEAKSFAHNLAPVKVGEAWGYVNVDGHMIIDPTYEDAGVFCADGSAPVKPSFFWNFIVLSKYDS